MTAPISPPPAVDLLAQAIAEVAPHFDRSIAVADRVRSLWAAVVAARDLGAADVIEDEFLKLAHATGLSVDLGRHGDEDVRHVICWAIRGWNPFP
jgi:hypothetical protein